MRNWAMCKKVQVESKIFLKHKWTHFLVFLLIPRCNHDRIIREFDGHIEELVSSVLGWEIRLDCG